MLSSKDELSLIWFSINSIADLLVELIKEFDGRITALEFSVESLRGENDDA